MKLYLISGGNCTTGEIRIIVKGKQKILLHRIVIYIRTTFDFNICLSTGHEIQWAQQTSNAQPSPGTTFGIYFRSQIETLNSLKMNNSSNNL